jgi:hypothetical protein
MNLSLPLTGIYDTATFNALEQFQVKYYESVLKPWVAFGLPTETTPTGYVYKTTKYTIDKLQCPDGDIQAPMLP